MIYAHAQLLKADAQVHLHHAVLDILIYGLACGVFIAQILKAVHIAGTHPATADAALQPGGGTLPKRVVWLEVYLPASSLAAIIMPTCGPRCTLKFSEMLNTASTGTSK